MPTQPSDNADSPPPAAKTAAQFVPSRLPPVDGAKLREAVALAARAARPAAATPAMEFGRFARRLVDATPETAEGVLAMQKFLRLDPVARDIESLKRDVAELKTRPRGQASARPMVHQQSRVRQGLKLGGGDEKKRSRKPKKQTTKEQASKLLRQLEKQVLCEICGEFGQPGESVIAREMVERVFSKSDAELTAILHERFEFPLSGRKTLSRTPVYASWAPHRVRGNSRRLDPESPAVDATAAGGESSASGATRNASYVAENGLSECRFGRIRPLDAEGRRKIDDNPEARAFALNHPELFGEDVEPCG